jgi:hypothetical protein
VERLEFLPPELIERKSPEKSARRYPFAGVCKGRKGDIRDPDVGWITTYYYDKLCDAWCYEMASEGPGIDQPSGKGAQSTERP